jgi:eukaryotic-like serine/threonine-protein kinase
LSVQVGTRFGSYEIIGAIGAGGMGEVYRARDTRLSRDVAIKILPASLTNDPDRRARFAREAQVLASLNHPNIAAIHHVEETGDGPALVMELVEGETLADRIARGPIPVDEALAIAKQIAEALEAAHEQGIIHRDLKPANIKVRPDGTVKVLDFGLAKLAEASAAATTNAAALSMSPTITSPALMSGVGVLLGTAAYMSPEQARGRAVDKRSDIWAFGCVLYEMLTGKRAFEGTDVPETLAAVLRSEPAWVALPAMLLPSVRAFLYRCLEKEPKQRVADIRDVRLALEGAFELSPSRTSATVAPLWKRLVPVGAALLVGVVGSAAVFALRPNQDPTPQRVARLGMVTPVDAPVAYDAGSSALAIAPDGSRIAYTSARTWPYATGIDVRLFVRALDQLQPTALASPGSIREPFFSADGAWIGFFGPVNNQQLQKILASGGPPIELARVDGVSRGATWGPDGTIVYATSNTATGLQRISQNGGEPTVLTRPNQSVGERDHLWPHFLPGGHAIVFTIVPSGAVENAQIAVLDLRDGSQKIVVRGGSDARYVLGGFLVYGAAGTLRAVPFDLGRLEVHGTPIPVLQDVATGTTGWANFAVDERGTLAYMTGGASDSDRRTLVWVDRDGREEPLRIPPRTYVGAQLSPDGMRVALDVRDQQNDIWIWDIGRETLQRLTFDPGLNCCPVWTPDGKRVAFTRAVDGQDRPYWQFADGSGNVEPLAGPIAHGADPTDFTPDGTTLIYRTASFPADIGVVPVAHVAAGKLLLTSTAAETNATVSPDGRWLAYQSDESGRDEVYIRPFPDVTKGRWQISTGGGTRPRWSRNGRELFYLSLGLEATTMMAVSVIPGSRFSVGTPKMLFRGNYVTPFAGRQLYDVAADGKRFLMIKPVGPQQASPPQVMVVQNWQLELRRLFSTN